MVYALSNRIYMGDWLIADWTVPWPLTEITERFRASGRFFWPVYYVLVVALVYATWRRFGSRTARIIIIATVALQLADTQFLRDALAAASRTGYPQPYAADQWRDLLATHRFLKQYPSFQCHRYSGDSESNFNQRILLSAAELDKPTNSVSLARSFGRDCADEQAEGLNFDPQADGLYIYRQMFPISAIKALPSFRNWCREYQFGAVCSRNWDPAAQ
jgi:hypothetical protein